MSRFRRERLGADSPAWRRVRSEPVADCRVFRVRRDISANPRGGAEHDFYVVEAADWINVIPLTDAEEVVMIEQYRHGSADVTLEIPGGMVDEGESPVEAAGRELIEETGYASNEIVALGRTRPNPAIQDNWLHTFLARGARPAHEPEFDGTEHCAVRLVPLAEVPALIAEGCITHALVVVAFHRLALWRDGMMKEAVSY
ncbi:MAG TPA: NUDIX hydrolase [Pyrinomonadaceae bacterium]|nr:NUDIX hydrolase [Pyrinomonadaceae bacterium]